MRILIVIVTYKSTHVIEQTINAVLKQLKEEDRYRVVNAVWKPIIKVEDFDKSMAILEKNRGPRKLPKYDFIFTGICHCDECGRPLMGQTGNGRNQKFYYYGHSRSCS